MTAAAVCQHRSLPLSSLNESIQLIDRSALEASSYVQTLIKALSSSRLSDRLHHRCPPALTGICLCQVALSGLLAAVIIADVFPPSISFPQSRQSAAGDVVWEEPGERDQHKRCQDSSGVCNSTGNENCLFDRCILPRKTTVLSKGRKLSRQKRWSNAVPITYIWGDFRKDGSML